MYCFKYKVVNLFLPLNFLGVGGMQGDGDIYKPDNLQQFQKFVLENTDQLGVHFVMADGVDISVSFLSIQYFSHDIVSMSAVCSQIGVLIKGSQNINQNIKSSVQFSIN